jgi:adenylylsulfate kinase
VTHLCGTHEFMATQENPDASPAQSGLTVWFTGLSSSGKSTLSRAVCDLLRNARYDVESLDGDLVRHELSKGLGFSKEDRDENIRRIGFVADLLCRHGVIVLVSAISPYRAVRDEIRTRIGRFMEVHVNAPLAVCERRDVKGLYRKARSGELKYFTGIDDPYEPPLDPELVCHTDTEAVEQSAEKVFACICRYLSGLESTSRSERNS